MQTITLKIKNNNDVPLLISLAERLGITIIAKQEKKTSGSDNAELFSMLQNFRKKNGLFEAIKNPVQWQKQQRKEKELHGRS